MDPELEAVGVPVINTETGEETELSIISDDPVKSARQALEEQEYEHMEVNEEKLDEPEGSVSDTEDSDTVSQEPIEEVDVEAREASEKETESKSTPDELLEEYAQLYRDKNDEYGNAWRLAGETMATWAQVNDIYEIDAMDPEQMVSLCLYVQRLHKLIRAFNVEFGQIEPNFESVLDSHGDESTYAAMHEAHTASKMDSGDSE